MTTVENLIYLTEETLLKTLNFKKWARNEPHMMNGDVEEAWPRNDEYDLLEGEIRNLAKLRNVDSANFKSHQSFIDKYAGNTHRRYAANEIVPEPGDGNSPYRELLAADAEALILWLRHAKDFLRTLKSNPAEGNQAGNIRTILFASASPENRDKLQLEIEQREIREELERAGLKNAFALVHISACRPEDFVRYLHRNRPEIVHFSGHGSDTGELLFENENRKAVAAPIETVTNAFRHCTEFVRCVVLNACFTDRQARELTTFVPYVMGMSTEVEDRFAVRFSKYFYMQLGNGLNYPEAFDSAVTVLKMEGNDGTAIPMIATPTTFE